MKSWKVEHIDGVNGGASHDAVFWRDAERRKMKGYEHSLLSSGERIQSILGDSKYSRPIERAIRIHRRLPMSR